MMSECRPDDSQAIAIIGMALRVPGARNTTEFWDLLRDGREAIVRLSDNELRAAGVTPEEIADARYVKAGAFLSDMEMFDAGFFGFSPRDAAIMDPQHRHFLECAWEALEDAGHAPDTLSGPVGVFGGSGMHAYLPYNLLTNPELMRSVGKFLIRHTGNDKDFLTTRVSYQLNLTGPSVNVQTACSTSLVAVHLACQSLLSGECDMALAGGVSIELPHRQGYLYQEGEILAPDGHCRSFDSKAAGTVFGSGAGIVVLRRLSDARADGDHIHAIVRGSAINNDGSGKVGYLAPSVDGQARVIADALAIAGVEADDISYVEAHGTATPVGDPIEIAALTAAFRRTTDRRGFCRVGSVKSNIGHLDTAAGVAGLIKTALALQHRSLPATLHFEERNSAIDFDSSPFRVNAALSAWDGDRPLRAGVSSLGVGGTNAHVILEEPPRVSSVGDTQPWRLVPLSARTPAALDTASRNLVRHLEQHPDLDCADVAFTCARGRKAFSHRRFVVARDTRDAAAALRDDRRSISRATRPHAGQVAFMFPGGGTQAPGVGAELYQHCPLYREEIDRGLAYLKDICHVDVRSALFPAEGEVPRALAEMERPSIGLPALFVTEYALARLWMSWGVQPSSLLGHSLGEYAAACIAGVFSLEQALHLVVHRGRLFEQLPAGAMLSVPLPSADVRALADADVSIAAINAPTLCVASGSVAAVSRLEERLAERGVESKRLKISVAAHSALLSPILDEFGRRVQEMQLSPPAIPIVSNVTGRWLTDAEATDYRYWVAQLRNTVRFADGVGELLRDPSRVLLEVGPGASLGSLARLHPDCVDRTILSSLPRAGETASDLAAALTSLGRLWSEGIEIDWVGLYGTEPRRRVPLPTYPFERQRHWIEPGRAVPLESPSMVPGVAADPERLAEEDWFVQPVWHRVGPAATPDAERRRWLVFVDECGIGSAVESRLRARGDRVVCVQAGSAFRSQDNDNYEIQPGEDGDYSSLIEALVSHGATPDVVLHLWGVTAPSEHASASESVTRNRVFHSPICLARALGNTGLEQPMRMTLVSNGLQRVDGEPVTAPAKALLLGPVRVIPREMPHVQCRSVDVAIPSDGGAVAGALAAQLIAEALDDSEISEMALRAGARWMRSFEPVRPETSVAETRTRLRTGGVYVITGGLGGLGLTVADYLARTVGARLVLVSRSGLPSRHLWDGCLLDPDGSHDTRQRIRAVRAIERAGAEVLVHRADVTDASDVDNLMAAVRSTFGAVHGVFHAAGVLSDGPLQLKSREAVDRVLAPKVDGTLLLYKACQSASLDFVVLFSSVSAFLGLPGQVDYTAANAFLNAFAESCADGPHVVAIDWGVWQGVGMATSSLAGDTDVTDIGESGHPLLGKRVASDGGSIEFVARYSEASHWTVGEHRLAGGRALLPGTGYVEIARAALAVSLPGAGVEIRDLSMTAPLEFASEGSREVRISMGAGGDAELLVVRSRDPHTGREWTEHARGRVRRMPARNERRAIDVLAARCRSREIVIRPGDRQSRQEAYLDFGPRWKNLRHVAFGEREALAVLELDEAFDSDLAMFQAHPALLDLATSAGLPLLSGYGEGEHVYVPLSYQRIQIHAPLTRRVVSHVRCSPVSDAHTGLALFDVEILDEDGRLLIAIDQYAMRRLPASALAAGSLGPDGSTMRSSRRESVLDTWAARAIRPPEGQRALASVLNGRELATVLVSPIPIAVLMDGIRAQAAARPATGAADDRAASYTAPRDDIERSLASIWMELLGGTRIGIHDDFFDLGGHSLTALRLCARLKSTYGVNPGIAALFEARTIAALAALVRRPEGTARWNSIVPIRPQGSKTPFYCVHGVGGEVLRFRELAEQLDPERPFYAFHAPGHNGEQAPLDTIEDMAALYVKDLRAAQPEGPYLLGGYSLGARVALEMAQRLRADGADVAFVGAIDLSPSDEPSRDWWYPARVLYNLPRWVREDLLMTGARANLARIRRHVRAGLRRLAGLRPGSHDTVAPDVADMMEVGQLSDTVRRIYELSYLAGRRYRAKQYAGAVTLFRATARPVFGRHEPDLGWSRIARSVSVRHVPGNHLDMLSRPYVIQLARELGAALDEATFYGRTVPSSRKVASTAA